MPPLLLMSVRDQRSDTASTRPSEVVRVAGGSAAWARG